jgi:ankyrin repeat protein
LNLVNNKGECLLHNAVFYKNSLIVQWLLENGAEPNILGEKGDTPLYRATLQDQVDIVNQLLKVLHLGASPLCCRLCCSPPLTCFCQAGANPLLTQPGHKRPLEVAKHPAILAKLTAAELACKKQKELGEWLASIGLEKYVFCGDPYLFP